MSIDMHVKTWSLVHTSDIMTASTKPGSDRLIGLDHTGPDHGPHHGSDHGSHHGPYHGSDHVSDQFIQSVIRSAVASVNWTQAKDHFFLMSLCSSCEIAISHFSGCSHWKHLDTSFLCRYIASVNLALLPLCHYVRRCSHCKHNDITSNLSHYAYVVTLVAWSWLTKGRRKDDVSWRTLILTLHITGSSCLSDWTTNIGTLRNL